MRRLAPSAWALWLALGFSLTLWAQSNSSPNSAPPPPAVSPAAEAVIVPTGERLVLELQDPLNTRQNRTGDEVHFTTVNEAVVNYLVAIPRGSSVRGKLTKVKRPGLGGGAGQIQIQFQDITLPDGTTLPLQVTLLRAGFIDLGPGKGATVKGEGGAGKRNATVVAMGAGQGALLGVILGGGKGAAVGGAVGAGVGLIGVLMQRGPHLDLPPGTLFEVKLDRPLEVPEQAAARFSSQPPAAAQPTPSSVSAGTLPALADTVPPEPAEAESKEPIPDFSNGDTSSAASNSTTPTPAPGAPAPPPATTGPPLPPTLDPTLGDPNAYRMRVDVRLVLVEAMVRDRSGRSLDDLTREDFRILEDGVEQPIRHFSRDELPMAVALVVDRSGSVAPYMPELRRAAYETLSGLKPGDEVCLFAFDANVDRLEDLTTDRRRIAERIAAIHAAGGTNITDALFAAAQYLGLAAPDRRRAIILISDNYATVPGYSSQSGTIRMALDAEVVVYSIKTPGENIRGRVFGIPVPTPGVGTNVRKIAEETGGEVFDVRQVGSLQAALAAVISRLKTRYTLGYSSTNKARDGAFRHIEVRLVDRYGRPGGDYTVHARTGYYAPTERVASQPVPLH